MSAQDLAEEPDPVHGNASRAFLPRTPLLRTLAGAARARVPLVVLEAPAGYGKTSLLRRWAAEDPREFAWVRLRDTGAHGAGLIGSVRRAQQRLTSRIVLPPREFVLVLDGTPLLSHSACADLRDHAAALPPGCQIAVASRDRSGLGGPGTVRLGADRLAFTAEETRDALVLAGFDGADAVRVLTDRIAGWPAGVALAAQALPGRTDVTAATGFGGGPRVTEYFRHEVLDRQPPDVRAFVLRSSVLAELSGPVCDAVLGTTGSAALLRVLHDRGLFLSAGHERGWYRWHPLFADVLRAELRHRHPDEERVLHGRAATWFAREGHARQAVDHAIASGDLSAAAQLVAEHAKPLLSAGRSGLARTWIEALGDEALRLHPPLGVTAAWVWATAGDAPRALRSAMIAQRGGFEGPPPDGSSSIASGVAMVRAATAPLGVERMLLDAELAAELEPTGTPWHSTATLLLGSARLMTGDFDGAVTALLQAARAAAAASPVTAQLGLAQLALLAARQHDRPLAERYATEAASLMRSGGCPDHLPGILTHAASALVGVQRADRQLALSELGPAVRLYRERPPAGFPSFAAEAAIVLGRLLLDVGDVPGARGMAVEARRHVRRLLTEGMLGEGVRGLEERLPPAGPAGEVPAGADLSTAELRVLEMLPTHLPLAEIGEQLHLSRNTVKSHVSAIHRKLGCTTRAGTVLRARGLGLLVG